MYQLRLLFLISQKLQVRVKLLFSNEYSYLMVFKTLHLPYANPLLTVRYLYE